VSAIRVLRVYHSAVVAEYRHRERLLAARHGYEVHLVCPPSWPEGGSVVEAAPDPQVPVHVVDVRGRRHPILFWYATAALRRLLRELRPDIVDLHEEPYSLAAAAALRAVRADAPDARVCIYTAQNILKRYPPPFRQLEGRALATAAAAYPCSTEAGEVLRAKGFTGALHVLPLGVTVEPEPEEPRADGALRVGFLGRLVPEKGADVAVRAFALAGDGLDARLEVVGAGPQEQELRELAGRLGVGARVAFPGALSQQRALERIRGYDALLVPSLSTPRGKEQFGRVAAQALAAGTPVVASDSGSLPEVLGGCGELAREGDAEDLADKLGRLLRDPARRAQLAARGRRRAVEELSWERVADGFDRMYRQVLADA
jgi:glycosyltransferase involved in cell wall biosynthesis